MSQFEKQLEEMKQKLAEARKLGVIEGVTSGAFNVLLMELMQETERRRQALVSQADTYELQAKAARAQAGAFQVFGSIANSIIAGMVHQAKRALEEEADREFRRKQEEEEETAAARSETAADGSDASSFQTDSGEASDKAPASKARRPSKPK